MYERLIIWASTGLGIGYVPKMPGTCGSLWGVLLFYFLQNNFPLHAALAVGITLIGIWISGQTEKITGKKDWPPIVIDEVAGQLITYLFVPYSITNLVLGFVLFRIFDMSKIFPANWAQNKLPGGYGIVLDDVIAALQAGIILFLINM